MRKWMLTCAVVTVGCFFAEPTKAQETIKPATTVITSSQPNTSAPRSGLLGRLRNRRPMTTTVGEPLTTTTQTTTPLPQAKATQMVPNTQVQMVESRRGLLGRMRPSRQMVTVLEPATQTTTTATPMPTVQQTQATPIVDSSMTTPVSQSRQGLLSRMRSRLGR